MLSAAPVSSGMVRPRKVLAAVEWYSGSITMGSRQLAEPQGHRDRAWPVRADRQIEPGEHLGKAGYILIGIKLNGFGAAVSG